MIPRPAKARKFINTLGRDRGKATYSTYEESLGFRARLVSFGRLLQMG
jgi:hypothetical protein